MKLRPFALAFALLPLALLASPQQPTAPAAYQVQLILHTHPAGKPETVRTFSLSVRPKSSQGRLSAGDNVPIETGTGKYDYANTGLQISCSAYPTPAEVQQGQVSLAVQFQITSAVQTNQPLLPVLRNARADIDAVVPLGRTVQVAQFSDGSGEVSYTLDILAQPANAAPAS